MTKSVKRCNKTELDGLDDLHGMEFWSPWGVMNSLDVFALLAQDHRMKGPFVHLYQNIETE